MKKRLSKKSEKVIKEVMEQRLFEHPLALVAQVGARMMLQVALEEEVMDVLGRDQHERRREGQVGSRNGYKERVVKLSCGDIAVEMPQVRGMGKPFHSGILQPYQTRMEEVEEVVPLLFYHGLSTRKVKRSVKKLLGQRGLSHQTVSRIAGKIVEEFKGWKAQDLSGLKVLYLILDGIRLGVRAGTAEKEAVLVAQAFLEGGSRVLLSVALGNRESHNAWRGFLEDMQARGLRVPLLIITDGSPGLLRAVEEIFAGVRTQRCTKHKMENVLEKVLQEDQPAVADDLRRVFYAPTLEHAREAAAMFEKKWRKYPSAVECLLRDLEACLTYYQFPYAHWKRIRTTNAIERSFREVRQRVRGIGRFQDEERALAMVYWQIQEAQQRWRGLVMTEESRKVLSHIRGITEQRMAA
jgi:transposase-like protein